MCHHLSKFFHVWAGRNHRDKQLWEGPKICVDCYFLSLLKMYRESLSPHTSKQVVLAYWARVTFHIMCHLYILLWPYVISTTNHHPFAPNLLPSVFLDLSPLLLSCSTYQFHVIHGRLFIISQVHQACLCLQALNWLFVICPLLHPRTLWLTLSAPSLLAQMYLLREHNLDTFTQL